jgi:hypothetical protein
MTDQLKKYREEQSKKFKNDRSDVVNDGNVKLKMSPNGINLTCTDCQGVLIDDDGIMTVKTKENGKHVIRKYDTNKQKKIDDGVVKFESDGTGSNNSNISILGKSNTESTSISFEGTNCKNISIGNGFHLK